MTQMVAGDHSINLLIEGLITLIMFALFLIGYYANIKNAYNAGKLREKGVTPNNFRQTLYYIFEWKFAQSFLTLPAIGILFYGHADHLHGPAGVYELFRSKQSAASKPGGLGWLQNLYQSRCTKIVEPHLFGVLTWTIIWAVLATVTTYFGGVLVALLIQQKEFASKVYGASS